MKKIITILALVLTGSGYILSQEYLSDTINKYLEVQTISSPGDNLTYVGSPEISFFSEGDKVLLIQHTGNTLLDTFTCDLDDFRGISYNRNHTGKYEIVVIREINTISHTITFTRDFLKSYDSGEKIQLVKVKECNSAIINGTLRAKEWDGHTGGIIALLVFDTLRIASNIDVSESGFRGGKVDMNNFAGGCRQNTGANTTDTLHFMSADSNKSGNKGEGILTITFPYTRGVGYAVNGGGGGNGEYSGGGGGSNYGYGGNGGRQHSACTEQLIVAAGGIACETNYYNPNDRVLFGGGGGSGVQNTGAGRNATNGGDGGGIVIIITDVIIGENNSSILASGQGVTSVATASGGGGGAGGSILIDANTYTGGLNLDVRGGKGGNTNSAECTGAGGGGGGGIIWFSSSTPYTGLVSNGAAGQALNSCPSNSGTAGSVGTIKNNLNIPLNGFLFNVIRGTDTICSGPAQNIITGTQPKGGNGTYGYNWIQSTDQINWSAATGAINLASYSPGTLNSTTYFKRIVTSSGQTDTSDAVEIFVYPAITNNTIFANDTICRNKVPLPLTGNNAGGGNYTSYTYQWRQRSTMSGDWVPIGSSSYTNNPLVLGPLTNSMYYRRIVTSSICADTSNTLTITVLPSITNNNFITPDSIVCQGRQVGRMHIFVPQGGDGTYSYLWQKKTTGNWTNIIPSTDSVAIYVGTLAQTTIYRRIVYSGNDNACIDSLNSKTINILTAISNNTININPSTYCSGSTLNTITGSDPDGGDGAFLYNWLRKTGSGNWQTIQTNGSSNYMPSGQYTDTTIFRRTVYSGEFNTCVSNSNDLTVNIIPEIVNELNIPNQSICEGETPDILNPTTPVSGGTGSYIYLWQKSEDQSAWVSAPVPNNQFTYTPGVLLTPAYYRRQVTSGICSHTSNTITAMVYQDIENNSITGGKIQYACFNSSKQLAGSIPTDGKSGDYAYQWQVSADSIIWSNATGISASNLRNFTTNLLNDSLYFKRIVFSSATNQECLDTSKTVLIRINSLPAGDIVSMIDTICANNDISVKFNLTGENGRWKVTVGNEEVSETRENITNSYDSIYITLSNTQMLRMLEIEDDSLCLADLVSTSGRANIFVYQNPVANAGEDAEICGLTYNLNATRSIPNTECMWHLLSGNVMDSLNPSAVYTIQDYGNTQLYWMETNWHCTDSDAINLTFYQQPNSVYAGEDQILDFKFIGILNASPASIGHGFWKLIDGSALFTDSTLYNAGVSYLDINNPNIFVWSITNGVCETIADTVSIIVNPLKLTKGFTPDGNNHNRFEITIENSEYVNLTIFDRLGHVVFKAENYNETNYWDGTNTSGSNLPEGTYFIVLKTKVAGNNQEWTIKSYVELIR